jgi:hypothetical protein
MNNTTPSVIITKVDKPITTVLPIPPVGGIVGLGVGALVGGVVGALQQEEIDGDVLHAASYEGNAQYP